MPKLSDNGPPAAKSSVLSSSLPYAMFTPPSHVSPGLRVMMLMRARGRALARERRLRTADDLDALQIEHRALAQVVAAVVDAVRERGDGLLECFVARRRADAAHDQRLPRESIAHEQVRHEDREILDVGEAALLDRLTGDRRSPRSARLAGFARGVAR